MPLPFTRTYRERRFWRWFSAQSDRLQHFERDQDAVFDALLKELRRVGKHLTFEFGPTTDGRREFIISAGGIVKAFPTVRALVAAAPPLPSWHVIAFRPPKSLDLVLAIGDLRLRADDVWFEAFPDGERIAVVMYLPGYSTEAHDLYGHAAFILLDSALGEFVVETRVGGIDIRPLPPDPAEHDLTSFRDIRALFDTTIH